MRALLDVNFLIGLNDETHDFHHSATGWVMDNAAHGWATCPLTQNGCLRIMSQPRYANSKEISVVAKRLQEFSVSPNHRFWPDDISLLDTSLFDHSKIHGTRQLTDLYLLALAVKHGGRLVTFDREIPLNAVRGAKRSHLVVV
jgi:uncharacterized protein